ncbi:MAG: YicC/YloC family endoribonuclease, partial [Rhodospirillales bacterium]
MTVTSMTGFARHEGRNDACTWTWEIKSVNGKGRDARCRLPIGFESLETKIRDLIAAKFRRGNFSVNLTLQWTQSITGYRINADLLEQIVALMPEIEKRMPEVGPPRIDGLLNLRGVVEPVEDRKTAESFEGLEESLLDDLDVTLNAL